MSGSGSHEDLQYQQARNAQLRQRLRQVQAVQPDYNREIEQTAARQEGPPFFRPEEMELIVCGEQTLDFKALERVTKYDGGYHISHKIVLWFWEIVHDMTPEQQKQLLKFVCGSDRAPVGGLSKQQFIIVRNGVEDDRLPTSHVCFSALMIPDYSSKDVLREQLLIAIGNSEGFGLR
ncbi:hypothetical protein KIPB_000877 [Kipferlia bialata]|uniref:HECT-type E3 ubiquitin transferase n=1 Tax=Kipferlia bialata TaxID=797122 RepID=A0A9K3GF36_9EUKA|nr:hypothetical protein KIPB_000877 [Kipferlia bialata]|eukprot:g877.t1